MYTSGILLENFWDTFGIVLVYFLGYFWVILGCFGYFLVIDGIFGNFLKFLRTLAGED